LQKNCWINIFIGLRDSSGLWFRCYLCDCGNYYRLNNRTFVCRIVEKEEGNKCLERVVFHIDVNSAFLSWEAVHRLEHLGGKVDLRNEIAAVGGDMSMRHGIILAKSIPAKQFHIKTGQSIIEAKEKCPNLQIVPPNYSLYERTSTAFIEILKEYSPDVEQYSIDEAFVDMSGTEKLWGNPLQAAFAIKDRICRELGFTVNIGISSNKLLAKMASGFKKPNRVHTLYPEEIQTKMWPLPVHSLFLVGRATARKLYNLGIYTISDLAGSDPVVLRQHLKKHGEIIWAFANGIDISIVEAQPPANKGYGNSTTIAFDVTDADTAKLVLLSLAETVGTRLRAASVKTEVIAVGIKSFELQHASHQMTLINPTDITSEIYHYAGQLFDQLWDGVPIRHLGIHTSRIKNDIDMRQINMFDDTDYVKLEKRDRTIDTIRRRYGKDTVKRTIFVKSRIDHMSGGISREKHTVDYKKVKVV